jgi:hypothetical protein
VNEIEKDITPILCVTENYIIINKIVKKNDDNKIMISNIEKIQIKEYNKGYLIRIKSNDIKSKYITLSNKNFEKKFYNEILNIFKELKSKTYR